MIKVAIIQARMGSTRYPGKVLYDIQGRSVLGHIIYRLKKIKALDGIVVATTSLEKDGAVVKEAKKEAGVDVFRGNEKDVLERFLKAGKAAGADYIVRVCGDCPFIDPQESLKTISMTLEAAADYSSNKHDRGVVSGAGIEVISMECLKCLDKIAKEPVYREHVTNYIAEGEGANGNRFNKIFVDADPDNRCIELDLSIDTEDDIRNLDKLAFSVKNIKDMSLGAMIGYCKKERLFYR